MAEELKIPDTHVEFAHVETGQFPGTESDLNDAQQKRVMRRVDWRLLPMLGLMYSISLIDRTNLGLAYVAGMEEDLGLRIGSRYTVLVMIFFAAYLVFEIPSTLILPKVGPANWLSFLGISFGSILIGMGFTNSWKTMAVCRVLLGAMEAGFLPGCTYLITCWYTRYEVGKRLSIFWIMAIVLSGFAAIFAYALTLLKGAYGLNGWRWIFIIEGAITIGVCTIGWFVVVDFPAKDTTLPPVERQFIVDRINKDRGDAEEDTITLKRALEHLKDWKIYFWSFNLLAAILPGHAYSYFQPIILTGIGFTNTQSQLLSAPPYILAGILCYTSGWISDKYRIRGPIIAVHQLLTVVGMLITAYGRSNGFRYFGVFLGLGSVQFGIPGVLAFQANNITSHSKRAISSATGLIGGAVGGMVSGAAFKSSELPYYPTGIWVTFAINMVSILLIIIMDIHMWRANKRARETGEKVQNIEGWYYTL